MSVPHLARLQPVPLREAWPHEAGSFTPWLAQCDNLQLLGDTIGMALECEAQEQAVGTFSADILCRDLNTDKWVLIENQIERTDHSHLGQLLTYAAGLTSHRGGAPASYQPGPQAQVADTISFRAEGPTHQRQGPQMIKSSVISLAHK